MKVKFFLMKCYGNKYVKKLKNPVIFDNFPSYYLLKITNNQIPMYLIIKYLIN